MGKEQAIRKRIWSILADHGEIYTHYKMKKYQILISLPEKHNLSDGELKKMIELAKDERMEFIIADKDEIIIINRKGVVDRRKTLNSWDFMRNMIVTEKAIKHYEFLEE